MQKKTILISAVVVVQAKREFDPSQNLCNQKIGSKADYKLTSTAYQTAKSNITSAQANLTGLRSIFGIVP